MKILPLFFLSVFFYPTYAYAYLDPGSGSILLYLLISTLSALAYSGKSWLRQLLFFLGLREHKHSDIFYDLIFHIEGPQYWTTFAPILEDQEGLDGLKILVLFYGEINLPKPCENITFANYKNEDQLIFAANQAKGSVFVSTTPNLDVYMLRRSKKVMHYSYIFHAPTDVAFYEKHALDSYDSVFCVGPFQKKSIRKLESLRNLKEKTLFESGCLYYDVFAKTKIHDNPVENILYAPSWGQRCSLKSFGIELVHQLNELPMPVVLRPHPQLYISDKKFMLEVENAIDSLRNVTIDKKNSPLQAFASAALLISDISGVIFDFAFLKRRPTLLLDTKMDLEFYEAGDLDEIWDLLIRPEIGKVVGPTELKNIPRYIDELLDSGSEEKISKILKRDIYNFSSASPVVVKQLQFLVKSLNQKTSSRE